MDTEKLIRQLFVGKVAEVIGIEKTAQLLKEAKDEIGKFSEMREQITKGEGVPVKDVLKELDL